MRDKFGRTIEYLRISVTDRCNLRCKYCMPIDGVPMLTHEDILTYDEITRLAGLFAKLGIKKIKITGGEPLVRKNLSVLIKSLRKTEGIEEITLTTNGTLFQEQAADLVQAGINKVNISLDTLDEHKYQQITGKGMLRFALDGIDMALDLNIPTSINVVTLKEYNYNEIEEFAKMAQRKPVNIRFIEMMPIGLGANTAGYLENEIMKTLIDAFGEPDEVIGRTGNGPASYYHFKGFSGNIGLISSISNEFCSKCNKVRLMANGFLKLCLGREAGIDLKEMLRNGTSDDELLYTIETSVYNKPEGHKFLYADGAGILPMSEVGG